jgi:hypothetical protein
MCTNISEECNAFILRLVGDSARIFLRNVPYQKFTSSELVGRAITLYTYIRDVFGSNLDRHIDSL